MPWPCPTRKRELRAEYADAPVSLTLYLGSYLVQATDDMPWTPAGVLHRRFLGMWWISEPNVGVATQLIGGQHIRFEYYPGEGSGRRFVGGEDFASAAKYKIHKHKDGAFELTLG